MDRTEPPAAEARPPRRWPVALIAAPAAVAVWSGWVGLAAKCGFGPVQPLPGIAAWHLDTSITLPVGVEAYGAYALGVWLAARPVPPRARRFALWSAIGSLALGMAGQIAYHLLAAAGRTRAPWEVVVLVSCMPVAVVGCAAALAHLRRAVPAPGPAPQPVPEPYPAAGEPPAPDAEVDRLIAWLTSGSNAVPGVPGRHREAEALWAAELVRGEVPSIRDIRRGLRCGQDTAAGVQAHLRTLVRTPEAAGA
jgi:hypothetical protein